MGSGLARGRLPRVRQPTTQPSNTRSRSPLAISAPNPCRRDESADAGADRAAADDAGKKVPAAKAGTKASSATTRRHSMNPLPILAVFGGAGVGALMRWRLGIWLNPLFPTVPLGTLAANLIGGFLIGVFSAWFSHDAGISPETRLLVITGFLGGLTTFSTFSAEVVTLLAEREYAWALGAAGAHLAGSLLLTALGILLAHALFVRA
jgi:CrcB protein